MMARRAFPVANLGRPGRPRIWMGQVPSEEVSPDLIAAAVPNRLSEVPVEVILARDQLLFAADEAGNVPDDQAAAARTAENIFASWSRAAQFFQRQNQAIREPELPISSWSADDYRLLVSVLRDPTEAEIRDLSLVDGFFARPSSPTQQALWGGTPGIDLLQLIKTNACAGQVVGEFDLVRQIFGPNVNVGQQPIALPGWMKGGAGPQWGRQAAGASPSPFTGNPFFCTAAEAIAKPTATTYYEGKLDELFNISKSLPWEEAKGPVLRAAALLSALVDYPFPRPISIMPHYWTEAVKSDMQGFVRQDILINRILARVWITMAVAEKYDSVSAAITRALKKKAKRQKRRAIIKAIALTVVFAIITFGLGAAFAAAAGVAAVTAAQAAQAVTSAVQYAVSAREKRKAAQDLERIAKLFEKDDAGFAAEARQARDFFDYVAGQEAAAAPLSEEDQAAIAEGETEQEDGADTEGVRLDVPPEAGGPSTEELLIGGGIAAAAAVAVALIA